MCEILQAIVSILGAIATPIITLAGVWLGWRLSSNSQRVQRRLNSLNNRFAALREVMQVVDNVPPDLTHQELVAKIENDNEFRKSLMHRLLRLFGLRNELVPSLDRELIDFIDATFRPLFVVSVGSYELRSDRVVQFGAAAFELRRLVQRVEQRLLAEHDTLSN